MTAMDRQKKKILIAATSIVLVLLLIFGVIALLCYYFIWKTEPCSKDGLVVLFTAPFGMDELTYERKSVIFKDTYSQCIKVDNYFISDEMKYELKSEMNFDISSQEIRKREELLKKTEFDFSVEASAPIPDAPNVVLGGSLSTSYLTEWRSSYEMNSLLINYKASLQVITLVRKQHIFDDNFKKKIISILDEEDDNLIPLKIIDIVNTYGTAYFSETILGGLYTQSDHINRTYALNMEKTKKSVRVAGEVKLKDTFSLKTTSQYSEEKVNLTEYAENTYSSNGHSVGGKGEIILKEKNPPDQQEKERQRKVQEIRAKNKSRSLNDWFSTIKDAPAQIGGHMKKLYSILTTENFPDHESKVLEKVKEIWINVTNEYFIQNLYFGCTDPTAPAFNPCANAMENETFCKVLPRGLIQDKVIYGGVYKECIYLAEKPCTWSNDLPNLNTQVYDCPGETVNKLVASVDDAWGLEDTVEKAHIYVCIKKVETITSNLNQPVLFGGFVSVESDCPIHFQARLLSDSKFSNLRRTYVCEAVNISNPNETREANSGVVAVESISDCLQVSCSLGYKLITVIGTNGKCVLTYCAKGLPIPDRCNDTKYLKGHLTSSACHSSNMIFLLITLWLFILFAC